MKLAINLATFSRYVLMGILVAASQIVVISVLVELAGMRSVAGENITNLASIAVSIVVGYFLHGRITCPVSTTGVAGSGSGLWPFLMFHAVTFISAAIRTALFYALSLSGLDYRLNALLGVAVAVVLNFLGYDRLVFRRKSRGLQS